MPAASRSGELDPVRAGRWPPAASSPQIDNRVIG
jgi:hypothetical protein